MAKGGRNLIYGLIDPRSGEIRYVGKSVSGLRRPRYHYCFVKLGDRTYKTNWIRKLQKLGLEYQIVVLEKCLLPEQLVEAEKRWIAHYRSMGNKLTNLTDGAARSSS